jgi:hypothetical protein
MQKISLIFFTFFFLLSFTTYSQKKFTISGYVKDEKTGEEIISAYLIIQDHKGVGTVSNAYGFYSITISEGNYVLSFQALGYEHKTVQVALNQNTKLDLTLAQYTTQLDEVVITAEKKNTNVTKTQMGIEKINVNEIKNIPVLFGEKDILKTIQLLPGVKSSGEGNSGFYVRGGNSDQNLILLDEATVYNASHLLGFFSVFNADALKDVTLYKGGQPSEFGGRLSSVLDIRTKDGSDKNYGVEGGIGLISSRLTVEGPLVKDKGSFTISGRRTYADLFLKMAKDTAIKQGVLYFYDLNAKANYRLNANNRIYLSGYFGKDVLGFGDRMGVNWGNSTGTLRWNHLFSNRVFSNTSLIFSDYNYNINTNIAGTQGEIISKIQDYNLKQDFQFYPDYKNKFKLGFNSIYHVIVPGTIRAASGSTISELDLTHNHAWENAVYASREYKSTTNLSLEYGIRLTSFSLLGPGDYYSYNSSGKTTDTTTYTKNEVVKTYFSFEPRLSANILLDDKSSFKAAYGRNTQNLHLLSNSTSGNPTDMWIPSSKNVAPEIADQVSLGYFRNFNNNNFEFSAEGYYKYLQNQIDYKDGAELRFNENVESQLLFGTGRAYGIEFLLKKKTGRFNGWIGYTLSRTEKKIDGINNFDYYPAKQDRTHDISIVAIYELSKKLTMSGTWVYYTGNAVTFPSGKYELAGKLVNYYTERNGYRMPDYHRLDIGLTWQRKKTEKFESSWNFSLYNAYGQENPYSITFQADPNDATKSQAVQTTLFRWVPSVTYNFKF